MQVETRHSAPRQQQINGVDLLYYLTPELFPGDSSQEQLRNIVEAYPIHERLIALPDLHFKVKNFVPSGMTIPIQGGFTPLLLGPNNDGLGSMMLRPAKSLSNNDIANIFKAIKDRVVMFRRASDLVNDDTLASILMGDTPSLATGLGFEAGTLDRFEDGGQAQVFDNLTQVLDLFPDERPRGLPDFVPSHNPMERGKRTLGVLDGTSHFIELFRLAECIDDWTCAQLGLQEGDLFFMVHAGGGDICLITHRAYMLPFGALYEQGTQEFQQATQAFAVTANFGFANRLFLYAMIRDSVQTALSYDPERLEIFSDIPHDYLQIQADVCIHRKGAARLMPGSAFPEDTILNQTGLPYLFPSTMGGPAYMIHHPQGQPASFETVSHGAGRLMPKDAAVEHFTAESAMAAVEDRVQVFRYGQDEIGGQHPAAFKDMNTVMALLEQFDLARSVARFESVACLKA